MSEHDDFEDEVRCAMIDAAIEELGDEVIEAIRADERELIIEFIRQDEWLYECGEQIADALEDCEHYEDEELH